MERQAAGELEGLRSEEGPGEWRDREARELKGWRKGPRRMEKRAEGIEEGTWRDGGR